MPAVPDSHAAGLADGWTLVSLLVPATPGEAERRELEKLGLLIAGSAPSLSWMGAVPVAYRETPAGEEYPCFGCKSSPVLAIRGLATLIDGDIEVFVFGHGRMKSLPLPAGDRWFVEMTDLEPGNYIAEAVPSRTKNTLPRQAFAVLSEDLDPLPAAVRIQLLTEALRLEGEELVLPSPYSSEVPEISISAPPLWECRVSWESESRSFLGRFYATDQGSLDVPALWHLAESRFIRPIVGDLVLDFAELGVLRFRLAEQVEPEALLDELRRLVAEKAALATALVGQFSVLRSMWVEPVCGILGYMITETNLVVPAEIPGNAVVYLLEKRQRSEKGVLRVPRRLLVLCGPGADFRDPALRSWVNQICSDKGLAAALFTDGTRWELHRRGSKLTKKS